tara:strand:- start:65 stop:280 length:216 start_codon:yes stop_codon:yes gene_type:complete
MKKLKELKEKLNPKVAMVGGVIILSTSVGTCQFMGSEPAVDEAIATPSSEDAEASTIDDKEDKPAAGSESE